MVGNCTSTALTAVSTYDQNQLKKKSNFTQCNPPLSSQTTPRKSLQEININNNGNIKKRSTVVSERVDIWLED